MAWGVMGVSIIKLKVGVYTLANPRDTYLKLDGPSNEGFLETV